MSRTPKGKTRAIKPTRTSWRKSSGNLPDNTNNISNTNNKSITLKHKDYGKEIS